LTVDLSFIQEAGHLRCTICSHPQVKEVNLLLSSGSSARRVARVFSLGRGAVTRHAKHVPPSSKRFAVLAGQGGTDVPPDPFAEAILLAQDAKTPRQKLRALEAVRGATRLRLRGMDRADETDLVLLDDNVRQAEQAYKASPDFETRVRALQGLRESITQRIDATPVGVIEADLVVANSDGSPTMGSPAPIQMTPERYWRDVPQRYRDPAKFVVELVIRLAFAVVGRGADVELRVRDIANGALAWTNERAATVTGGDA
jgi:hypothetical protein